MKVKSTAITVKVPGTEDDAESMFGRMVEKRHVQKTTFQDVGLRLFTEWLNGAEGAASLVNGTSAPQNPQSHQGESPGVNVLGSSATVSPSDIASFYSQLKAIQAQSMEMLALLKAAPRRDEAHTDLPSRGKDGNGEVGAITGGLDKELKLIEGDKPRRKKDVRVKGDKATGKSKPIRGAHSRTPTGTGQ